MRMCHAEVSFHKLFCYITVNIACCYACAWPENAASHSPSKSSSNKQQENSAWSRDLNSGLPYTKPTQQLSYAASCAMPHPSELRRTLNRATPHLWTHKPCSERPWEANFFPLPWVPRQPCMRRGYRMSLIQKVFLWPRTFQVRSLQSNIITTGQSIIIKTFSAPLYLYCIASLRVWLQGGWRG